jgi:acetyl esterase
MTEAVWPPESVTDPHAHAYLSALSPAPPRAFTDVTKLRVRRELSDPSPYRVRSSDVLLPSPSGLPARTYHPTDRVPQATVLYLHGGGWALGDLEINDHVCRYLAERSGLALISLDYPLAPEHPYPAALDASTMAATMIAEGRIEGLPTRLALAGLSAGAALAAGVALRSARGQAPGVHALALLCPVTDCDFDRPSYQEHAQAPILTTDDLRWFWSMYIPDAPARTDPDAAVLRAGAGDKGLGGLPSTTVVVAGVDPLRDEGIAFGTALRAAGVDAETVVVPGVPHGFMAIPSIEAGRRTLDRVARRLVDALGG